MRANPLAPLDAAIAFSLHSGPFSLHSGPHWRGASEAERSAVKL